MIDHDRHLQIGSLLFEGDLTGPFEVLSRIPNSTYRPYAKSMAVAITAPRKATTAIRV